MAQGFCSDAHDAIYVAQAFLMLLMLTAQRLRVAQAFVMLLMRSQKFLML